MINKKFFYISYENLINFSFIVYFANPFFISFFSFLKIPHTITVLLTLLMIYIPVFVLFFLNSKKYLKVDFVILYIFLILFFAITWLIHPEYTPYYLKREYGVFDTVFFPTHGIYAYLFIRLINNPCKILKNLKFSGYLMIFYFLAEIYLYTKRGFWYGVVGDNGKAIMSYSVSFGYQVLFFLVIFLYSFFKYNKKLDLIFTLMYIIMLFIGGSRGPFIFVITFIVVYWFLELSNRAEFIKHKNKSILFFISGFILYYFKNDILFFISKQIKTFGFSSRFIDKLLLGTIFSDSGRSIIWQKTIEMIKENPFGYGAMGSRHVITNVIFAGYPHNVILEILVDFGVFFGLIILSMFLINILIMFYGKNTKEYRGIFLVFLSCSLGLLLSLTYWNSNVFWGSIAIVISCLFDLKNKRKYRILSLEQENYFDRK